MNKLLLFFSSLFFAAPAFSQTPSLTWAKEFGGPYDETVRMLQYDKSGNLLVMGNFADTVDFDPGPGVFKLIALPEYQNDDIYIMKLTANGDFLWAKSMGGIYQEYSTCMAQDEQGNIYITGYYYGVADFDPGPGVYNLSSNNTSGDVFIVKLDANGNFVTARSIGGMYHEIGQGIIVQKGAIYLCGAISSYDVDFDFGPGVTQISGYNGTTNFIARYDTAFNFQWVKKISGSDNVSSFSLNIDDAGNIYTSGSYFGSANFDPEGSASGIAPNTSGAFILKLNPSGKFIWVKTWIGGSQYTRSCEVKGKNIFICGSLGNQTDLDPNAGVYIPGTANGHMYVSKLDTAGNFIWGKNFGGSGGSIRCDAYALTSDSAGSVYVTGQFGRSGDFDPGPDSMILTEPTGSSNVFILKLNSSGNFVYAAQAGGIDEDGGYAIVVDKNNDVIVGGGFRDTADFDPGTGVFQMNAPPDWWGGDAFLWKLSSCALPAVTITAAPDTICRGTNLQFTATATNAGTGDMYKWMVNGVAAQNTSQNTYKFFTTPYRILNMKNKYDITCVVTNTCGAGNSNTETVTVLDKPVRTSISGPANDICATDTATYQCYAIPGATYYTWVAEGGTILHGQGTTSVLVQFSDTFTQGNISVVVASQCGISNPTYYKVKCAHMFNALVTDISSSNETEFYLSVYPNPSAGKLFIDIQQAIPGTINYKLVNAMAQIVYEYASTNQTALQQWIDISSQPAGIYFLQVEAGGQTYKRNIVVAK